MMTNENSMIINMEDPAADRMDSIVILLMSLMMIYTKIRAEPIIRLLHRDLLGRKKEIIYSSKSM